MTDISSADLPDSQIQPPPSQAQLAWVYARTYLIGTWDSFENVLENIANRVGLPLVTPKVSTAPLNGKTCIVTGANAGIGLATSELLAARGAHVILACRSKERGEKAADSIRKKTKLLPGVLAQTPSVEVMEVDTGSLDSVRKFCATFNARKQPLHLLIANAGIMSPVDRLETNDGLEMQFQVNFLGHWLMTHELLAEQRRRRAAERSKQQRSAHSGKASLSVTATAGEHASEAMASKTQGQGQGVGHIPGWGLREDGTRVVIVSSLTHFAGILNWHDMQSRKLYDPFTSYALSKLANAMTAVELQRRLDRQAATEQGQQWGTHDSVVAVHPGVVNTALATNFFKTAFIPESMAKAVPFLQRGVASIVDSVAPVLFKTTESSAAGMGCAALAPSDKVNDPTLATELWSVAQRLTGLDIHESLL